MQLSLNEIAILIELVEHEPYDLIPELSVLREKLYKEYKI